MQVKKCGFCKKDLLLSDFYDRADRAGKRAHCKKCMKLKDDARALANPDIRRRNSERQRKRNLLINPEGYWERTRSYARKTYNIHKETMLTKLSLYPAERKDVYRKVYEAIKKGLLVKPDKCSSCGRNCFIHAHHADYSKPLEVEWLCVSCHKRLHIDEKEQEFNEQEFLFVQQT